jgi:hypothetical protein
MQFSTSFSWILFNFARIITRLFQWKRSYGLESKNVNQTVLNVFMAESALKKVINTLREYADFCGVQKPSIGSYLICPHYVIFLEDVFKCRLPMYTYVPGWRSRYSDWLRAGRPRGRSASPDRVKNFLFSTASRLALRSIQPPIQ